ncbi:HSF-type DNA-binding-domain-containing protein [Phlyctochytrium arcticum]|nr:HSF-type DNA-binding-domain-containing protein [Phlyctochytrium arcticum]
MVQKTTFIQKLHKILEEEGYQHLIRWSSSGSSFLVLDSVDFARNVLPKVFKHNNYTSFVRQLNLYGFHKTNRSYHRHAGMTDAERDAEPREFSHPKFIRYRPDLLSEIRRKSSAPSTSNSQTAGGGPAPSATPSDSFSPDKKDSRPSPPQSQPSPIRQHSVSSPDLQQHRRGSSATYNNRYQGHSQGYPTNTSDDFKAAATLAGVSHHHHHPHHAASHHQQPPTIYQRGPSSPSPISPDRRRSPSYIHTITQQQQPQPQPQHATYTSNYPHHQQPHPHHGHGHGHGQPSHHVQQQQQQQPYMAPAHPSSHAPVNHTPVNNPVAAGAPAGSEMSMSMMQDMQTMMMKQLTHLQNNVQDLMADLRNVSKQQDSQQRIIETLLRDAARGPAQQQPQGNTPSGTMMGDSHMRTLAPPPPMGDSHRSHHGSFPPPSFQSSATYAAKRPAPSDPSPSTSSSQRRRLDWSPDNVRGRDMKPTITTPPPSSLASRSLSSSSSPPPHQRNPSPTTTTILPPPAVLASFSPLGKSPAALFPFHNPLPSTTTSKSPLVKSSSSSHSSMSSLIAPVLSPSLHEQQHQQSTSPYASPPVDREVSSL